MTRNGQVHDGSADKFALRKTLRRHRGYPGGVDWHWRTSIRLRRRNGAHTGKRLAGKLHEPFERAGRGRAYAPPLPTLQCGRSCNGAGAKGLRCSALAIGQLETGGARGRGKAVQDPQTGSLGSLQACEGQPGGGWRRRTVDCGVRGQPCGQPLQALEPAVVRELLFSASAAGREFKSEWWGATVVSFHGVV